MLGESSIYRISKKTTLVTSVTLMIVGFALGYAPIVQPDQTLIAWLGYPEYKTPAIFMGWAGLFVAVFYGRYLTQRED